MTLNLYKSYLTNFKLNKREGQEKIIKSISQLLQKDEKKFAIIEAGTGIGKTVAYVLGSLLYAKSFKKTIIISTNTIALQEQIFYKDLPNIQSLVDFSYMLVKGKERYVCLHKLDSLTAMSSEIDLFNNPKLSETQKKQVIKLHQKYEKKNWNGELETIPVKNIDDKLWKMISVDKTCIGKMCSFYKQCSFFAARRALREQDIIVANHSMVLADLNLGGGAILTKPEETIYIFDEAHHLARQAIESFTTKLFLKYHKEKFQDILQFLKQHKIDGGDLKPFISSIDAGLEKLFKHLQTFSINAKNNERGDIETRIYRFENSQLDAEILDTIPKIIKEIDLCLGFLNKMQDGNKKDLEKEQEKETKNEQEIRYFTYKVITLKTIIDNMQILHSALSNFVSDNNFAKWLEFTNKEVIINSSPIFANKILQDNLWNKAFAAIMLSATLSTNKNFDLYKQNIGLFLNDNNTHRILSPFDYANRVKLIFYDLQTDAQKDDIHAYKIADFLNQTSNQQDEVGGILVLFTSKKLMQRVYDLLNEKVKINVLKQEKTNKNELLERHKNRIDNKETSILFGLDSFAEGIDLPGAYLTKVIITKLPFLQIGSPQEEALNEYLKANGRNSFMENSLPTAIIKFVQAFGRLMRSEDDFGEVIILDNRVNKRYWQQFKNSLPYDFNLEIVNLQS